MTTFNHYANDVSGLAAAIDSYTDAGIDPAFDNDLEELERQFAELRLALDHN